MLVMLCCSWQDLLPRSLARSEQQVAPILPG
jgi:hypothetical protein